MKENKTIQKYIPLDKEFMKRSMSDLVFAYIQINSYQTEDKKTWFCYKPYNFFSDIKRKIGFKSVTTVKTKYKKLLEEGFIKEGQVKDLYGNMVTAIIIPTKKRYYQTVDIEILKVLYVGTNERVIKIFAYLLNKYNTFGNTYTFTYAELIKECLDCKGIYDKNNIEIVRVLLDDILVKLGYVKYEDVIEPLPNGLTTKKRLLFVANKKV